jgi:hypothetical protein
MSFSIDVDTIFGYASDIVNALMPLIALTAGLAFGFYLAKKIASLFKGGFG